MDDLILPAILLVVGIVAVAFFLGPPKTASLASSRLTLLTNPNPPAPGLVDFTISVKDKNNQAADNVLVSYSLNMTNMDMGTQQGSAASQGGGNYKGSSRFSMRGPWQILVTANFSDGEKLSQNFDYNVR